MAPSPTGRGDPAKTLALLWRNREDPDQKRRKGPRQGLTVDAVVAAGIALADDSGLEALTMRAIAERLSVSPMTLYTYVPGKAELLDLMVDSLYLSMPRPALPPRERWREGVRAIADQNRGLFRDHPWAAQVSTSRPPLGPGMMAKYEYELGSFEGLGLSDVEIDAALTHLLAFVQATAVAAQAAAGLAGDSGVDDSSWWNEVAPLLERFVTPSDYPLASRVGTAAGVEQGSAYDPDSAYAFGLECTLDGLAALIDSKPGQLFG
jgi:AcrR family transcriptional regulator